MKYYKIHAVFGRSKDNQILGWIDRYNGMPDDVSDAILKHAQPQLII